MSVSAPSALEAQRADLEFARSQYVAKSPVFTPVNRERATAFIRRMQAQRQPASREQFLLAAMRIAALAGNAHDQVYLGDGWQRAARLPLHFIWFADALIVARTAPELDELLGARVERIEGMRPGEVLRRFRICMPNSAYCFHANGGYWDLQHGCSGRPGCYGDAYDARVASLSPDITAPLTAADWLLGRDAGMEAVMAALAAKSVAVPARPAR